MRCCFSIDSVNSLSPPLFIIVDESFCEGKWIFDHIRLRAIVYLELSSSRYVISVYRGEKIARWKCTHPLRWSIRLANLLHTIPPFNETYATLSRQSRRGVVKINNNSKTRIFQGSSRSYETRVQSSRQDGDCKRRGKWKAKVAMDITRKRYRPVHSFPYLVSIAIEKWRTPSVRSWIARHGMEYLFCRGVLGLHVGTRCLPVAD